MSVFVLAQGNPSPVSEGGPTAAPTAHLMLRSEALLAAEVLLAETVGAPRLGEVMSGKAALLISFHSGDGSMCRRHRIHSIEESTASGAG